MLNYIVKYKSHLRKRHWPHFYNFLSIIIYIGRFKDLNRGKLACGLALWIPYSPVCLLKRNFTQLHKLLIKQNVGRFIKSMKCYVSVNAKRFLAMNIHCLHKKLHFLFNLFYHCICYVLLAQQQSVRNGHKSRLKLDQTKLHSGSVLYMQSFC